MSDPRTPRPSDGWNAARRPGGAAPGQPAQPAATDPLESMFDAYARSTDITPAPDLTRRIHAAISREPARTPPRRFIVALFSLKLAAARDAFAQTAGVAFGKGRFPALVRAQALALVALTLGVVGLAAVGGAIGLRQVVDRFDVDDQAPTELVASPSPSTLPSLVASPSPSPSDAPSPSPSAVPSASPSAAPTESPDPTEEVTDDPTDDPTPDPTKDGGVEPRRTQEPDGGDKETPRPTQKPRATAKPTPRPTREPRETEKPEKTPKPTKKPTPEPDETEKPDETDEPDETDKPEDGGGGGNSGPGSAGQAWSSVVVAVGPVRLVITV